jgi:hypothetical protein
VDELSVVRWRRYGKDRLYVRRADGVQLGWCDLLSGDRHVERPEERPRVDAAIDTWLAGHVPGQVAGLSAIPVPQARSAAADLPAGVPVEVGGDIIRTAEIRPGTRQPAERDWEDLAGRAAGMAARSHAVALKDAAPLRTGMARLFGVKNEERAWRIGADGEEKVAAVLEKLARKDPRWCFLHAVPVGEQGSDIDHVVIGPGGVYTLNAKHHPGAKLWVGGDTFMVNGHRQPYVRNSRHEATRAGRLLSEVFGLTVKVNAIIVPVGADELTIKTAPSDVHIVNRMRLRRWLSDRPTTLDAELVKGVFDVARRSTTWRRVS